MEAKLVERTRAEREAAEAAKPRAEQVDDAAAPPAATTTPPPPTATKPAPPTCPPCPPSVPVVARRSLPPSIVRTSDERLSSYAWDQSDKVVTIYVPYAGAKTLGEEKIQFQCLGEYDFEVSAFFSPLRSKASSLTPLTRGAHTLCAAPSTRSWSSTTTAQSPRDGWRSSKRAFARQAHRTCADHLACAPIRMPTAPARVHDRPSTRPSPKCC